MQDLPAAAHQRKSGFNKGMGCVRLQIIRVAVLHAVTGEGPLADNFDMLGVAPTTACMSKSDIPALTCSLGSNACTCVSPVTGCQ